MHASRISELTALSVDDDGLVFDLSEIRAYVIREDDGYPGVRVRLVAKLGSARITIGIDVNFGDPIFPASTQIELPRLIEIGQLPVRLLGYPLPMVVAEKTVTALQRGEANTRWRDFADILTITRTHDLAADDVRAAFEAVATCREVTFRPLSLAGFGSNA
ncbi:nucleotidyl transferase AbiEii/AbiGii toxin family protein [uncultured Jatrophihabitans sp.]|uniref:nucleotidyl transferase AbiEii/AbiGii toxin family protein n=1 Tax=uncultured Jatrophihabitans sp. TaxID=1610747 RepID=UPI0035CC74FB